ncbi:MAG TPA: hypothetical protein VIZ62_03165 [Nitrososphaeraceae archaeon]
MQNLLPNKRNLKFEREINPAVVKTLFPRINVEDELSSSSYSMSYSYIIGSRQTYVAS